MGSILWISGGLNGKVMKERKFDDLLSAGFILSVLLLLVNDFFIKKAYPGIIAGKLSDFAGLFSLSYFLSVFFPKRRKTMYIAVGLLFTVWKMPVADHFIGLWNQNMPYSISRIVDYTDLTALLVLPIGYAYRPTRIYLGTGIIRRMAALSVASIAVFSFLATAGTTGRMATYKMDSSKEQVYHAVERLYDLYPSYAVPEEYRTFATPHFHGRENDRNIERLNADTVNFDFYIKEEDVMVWCSFADKEEDWEESPCEFVLVGYIYPRLGKWQFNRNADKLEKKEVVSLFEREIFQKIDSILKK